MVESNRLFIIRCGVRASFTDKGIYHALQKVSSHIYVLSRLCVPLSLVGVNNVYLHMTPHQGINFRFFGDLLFLTEIQSSSSIDSTRPALDAKNRHLLPLDFDWLFAWAHVVFKQYV